MNKNGNAPKLIYLSPMRLPTEKAHGLQIMQNCEALADVGYAVELWVSRRYNSAEMNVIQDVYAYYGVKPNFTIKRVPCVDLMPLAGERPIPARIAFYVQVVTYVIVMLLRMLFVRAQVYYSRDEFLLLPLSFIKSSKKLAYEPHTLSPSKRGRWIQLRAAGRVNSIFPVTPRLAKDFVKHGASVEKILPLHDGIRKERFQALPTKMDARETIGWDQDAFIVGYVGRLHTMGMDKGLGTLIQALAEVGGASLGLVGGPDEMAQAYCNEWVTLGLAEGDFLYTGHIVPREVPLYLSAFDLCAMPFPDTAHFANYMSPLKLFEYMAAGKAIIASDLPSIADVVAYDGNALLVPPEDVKALAKAIQRLREDPDMRQRLGDSARQKVMAHYTWTARAEAIRGHLERAQRAASSAY